MGGTAPDAGAMYGGSRASTFMGLPGGALDGFDAGIAVLGVPCATPYGRVGAYCADAPGAIRAAMAHYAATIEHHDFDLGGPLLGGNGVKAVDLGDLACAPDDPAGNRARIHAATRTILSRGAVPVLIGGDDSVQIPNLQAFAEAGRHVIVQVDAHIDWRDEVDGERMGLSSTMRRAAEMGAFERIIQVGQRGTGSARPRDLADAKAAGCVFVSGQAVQEKGIGAVLELVPSGSKVVFAFDCDGLDPSIMPAVIAPTPGGLSYWQMVGLLQGVAAKARIAGFNLVEFMPARDRDGAGALVAGRILANVIGVLARG